MLPSLQNLRCDADQVRNKTILPSNLRTVAAKKGFLVSDNQASGNCLFYALSEQLKSVKGIQISHKELRSTLVQFLRENANLVRRWCSPVIVCLTSSCWGKKWQSPLVSPIKPKTIKPIWWYPEPYHVMIWELCWFVPVRGKGCTAKKRQCPDVRFPRTGITEIGKVC